MFIKPHFLIVKGHQTLPAYRASLVLFLFSFRSIDIFCKCFCLCPQGGRCLEMFNCKTVFLEKGKRALRVTSSNASFGFSVYLNTVHKKDASGSNAAIWDIFLLMYREIKQCYEFKVLWHGNYQILTSLFFHRYVDPVYSFLWQQSIAFPVGIWRSKRQNIV